MNYEEILETEFSRQFADGMRDRMVVSFHKYGPLADAYPAKVDATSASNAKAAHAELAAISAIAKDKGKEAKLFAGLSLTDDPRAVEREAYLRILPEPNQSLTGCAAQMTAASRVQ